MDLHPFLVEGQSAEDITNACIHCPTEPLTCIFHSASGVYSAHYGQKWNLQPNHISQFQIHIPAATFLEVHIQLLFENDKGFKNDKCSSLFLGTCISCGDIFFFVPLI